MFLTLLVVFNFRDHALYLSSPVMLHNFDLYLLKNNTKITWKTLSDRSNQISSNCRKLSPATHVITSLSPQAIKPIS